MREYMIPFSKMCFMYKCPGMHLLCKTASSFSHIWHNSKTKTTLNPVSLG